MPNQYTTNGLHSSKLPASCCELMTPRYSGNVFSEEIRAVHELEPLAEVSPIKITRVYVKKAN